MWCFVRFFRRMLELMRRERPTRRRCGREGGCKSDVIAIGEKSEEKTVDLLHVVSATCTHRLQAQP